MNNSSAVVFLNKIRVVLITCIHMFAVALLNTIIVLFCISHLFVQNKLPI